MLRWTMPLAGALVLLVALVASLVVMPGRVRFRGDLPPTQLTTMSFGTIDSVAGTRHMTRCAGPRPARCGDVVVPGPLKRRRSVEIRYPREMRSDESAAVELRYAVNVDSTGVADPDAMGSRRKTVSLSGANFAVKPDEARPLTWHGRDTATIIWSVLPAHTGSHNLVVDASALYEGGAVHVSIFDMRGDKVSDIQADNVVLPVDVFTVWGIPERAADIGKAVLGLLTFGLSFIGFTELRSWLRGTKGHPAPKGGRARSR